MKINKVLVLLGQSQYQVLSRFAEGMIAGFKKLNIEVDILDARTRYRFELEKYNSHYDLFFCINGMTEPVILEEFLGNSNVLTWRFFVDHPIYHNLRLLDSHRNSIVSFIDQKQVDYVKEMYPSNPYVCFLPHAGELYNNTIPFEKRRYNISFFGSYSKTDSFFESLNQYDEAMQQLIWTITNRLYYETSNTLEFILAEELGKKGIQLSKEEFRATLTELTFVYFYVRNKKRHAVINSLLKAGLIVNVFGNGWENFESEYVENLCIHEQLDYTTALSEMANSKIVLNIMPLYSAGSHERIFNAMGAKSVVLTDENSYLAEEFENNKHLVYYSMSDLDNLPNLAIDILNNTIDVSQIIDNAFQRIAEKHLWEHRAYEIVKYCENIDLSNKTFVPVHNHTDYKFNELINFINSYDLNTLYEKMKDSCLYEYTNYPNYIENLMQSFNVYPYWGKLDPPNNNFEVIAQRAELLKNHLDDFIWTYSTLQDNLSKFIFLNLLLNWETLDNKYLDNCIKLSTGTHYFDLNLIEFDSDDVFVDLGAYTGDTLDCYLKQSRSRFKRIYCYECDSQNALALEKKTTHLNDSRIIIRKCAIGKKHGFVSMIENENARTGSHLSNQRTGDVEQVSLDDDIAEKITFIKSDVEGAEYDALCGAKSHIINDHPKLAISIYHGNKDFTRIIKLLHSMDSSYKFYIRYYGGNLYPNEIVLYAI